MGLCVCEDGRRARDPAPMPRSARRGRATDQEGFSASDKGVLMSRGEMCGTAEGGLCFDILGLSVTVEVVRGPLTKGDEMVQKGC